MEGITSMTDYANQKNTNQMFQMNSGGFDPALHEKQQKARVNNNSHFIRAQLQIFANISSTDRLIAYSLNQECQSLARTKHLQLLSLINNFQQPNAAGDAMRMKLKFHKIMQSRLQQSSNIGNLNLPDEEEEQDEEEEEEEILEIYEREDEEEVDYANYEEEHDNAIARDQEMRIQRNLRQGQQQEDQDNDEEPESDEDADWESANSN